MIVSIRDTLSFKGVDKISETPGDIMQSNIALQCTCLCESYSVVDSERLREVMIQLSLIIQYINT